MGSRHDARRWAVQLLFQTDFNDTPVDDLVADFWTQEKAPDAVRTFTEELLHGALAHLDEIDRIVQGLAQNWDLHRMSGVDRNIIRLAMYEMLYRRDIPPVVSINEAVEIAKEFGGPESGRFVNGILDRARQDVDRPARTTIDYPGANPAAQGVD